MDDKLFESVVVDKDVDINDIVVGDKNVNSSRQEF